MRRLTPDERPRILMVISHLGYGGAEGSFLRLARFLSAHADVRLALMMPEQDGPGSWAGDLPVVVLGDGDSVSGIWAKARRWVRMARRLRALKRDHDVAISFMSGPNLLNALAGFAQRTVTSERGSKRNDIGMSPAQRRLWTRLLDPFAYWRSCCVVAASEGLAHEIRTANPRLGRRVVAIEGTIDTAELLAAAERPVEPELAWLAGQETVVAYGRLHIQKGYDFLLRVFAGVRAERPEARLLLIGDGTEAERLRGLAEALGLRWGDIAAADRPDVVFAGYRPQPVRYARLGRVFAFPSRFEGLPNALIEALAAGVPVLASDCKWGPRSILSGRTWGYGDADRPLPQRLTHGVLMPVPDVPGAQEIWQAELARALAAPPARRSRDAREADVAIYDMACAGPRWLSVVSREGTRG